MTYSVQFHMVGGAVVTGTYTDDDLNALQQALTVGVDYIGLGGDGQVSTEVQTYLRADKIVHIDIKQKE